MLMGRLEFGIAKSNPYWGVDRCVAGCRILNLGMLYFTWLRGECAARYLSNDES